MKRVLIFSTAYFPFVGGAEIAIKEITDRLGAEVEFDLITAKFKRSLPSKEKIGAINVYRIGFGISSLDKLILPFWGAFRAIRLNKKQKYEMFWVVMVSFAGLAGFFANSLFALFGRRKKMILTLQEGDSEEHLRESRGGLINFSWKFAMKRADVLTAISNYLLERGKSFGFKGEKYLVPNGVDIDTFKVEIDKLKIREDLGFSEDDIVLVTTSRLVQKNGIADVVEALTFLPENIKFIIIGSGPLQESLRLMTSSLKLDARVKFLGFIPQKDIPKYLVVSDIFIRPSLSEGFGNSFIEAMAVDLPVIATPVGGIVDFLEDEKTGLFCEVRNPESIALEVKRYLENPALRTQIILNAKKMVLEKYDWNIIARDMKEKVFSVKI